jgi:hypothetical protein
MSMNAPMNAPQPGGLPRGELLGRYRSYEDAQKVVDHLAADEGFDIKHLTIVGNDLRTVEHIRTRLSYPRVALAGASQGAMFGAFIGLLIFLFSPDASLIDLGLAVVLGMAIWTLVGVIGYAVRKGKRDFASSSQTVATTFDVVCDFSVSAKARELVRTAGVQSVTPGNDPTGRPPQSVSAVPGSTAPAAGAAAHGAQAAGAGDSAPAAPGEAAGAAPSAPSRSTAYSDLPDGRPRFGVRSSASTGSTDSTDSTDGTDSTDSTADEPEGAESADEAPARDEAVGGEPVADQPAGSDPASNDVSSNTPTSNDPAASDPASSDPASNEPAGKDPAERQ